MNIFTKSKKSAVMLTYLSLVISTLSSMFLTRFYLNQLGTEMYGLYQMIYSVAHYILILDLGISTAMVRYVTEFDARDQHEKAENFTFHLLLIMTGIIALVYIIGLVINSNLESIYTSLTAEEYALSHTMFRVMILQIILTIVSHFFSGITLAYERFVFSKLINIIQIIVNTVLQIVLIYSGLGVLGITTANTVVIAAVVAVYILYDFFGLKFRIKFYYWDFEVLRPAAMLMLALLLQSVVGHVNSTVDKTILGMMASKTDVAVYSIAATIITMFNTMPTSISSVFQPKAVKLVVGQADNEKLTDFVIAPGRYQFMVVGAFLAAFFLFGQDFIICWAGKKMVGAWIYVIIIMIPNSVPLIQNVCLSILNAKDKRLFRSIVLAALTVVNIALTVVFIGMWGPIGAPVGTAISYLLGHCIIMNIYYKYLGLNVSRMFGAILKRIWICVLIALAVNLPLMLWKVDGNWLVLIAKAVVFCAVYFLLLVLFGFNKEEKATVSGMLKKITRNRLNSKMIER